ncbi:MAG TPA: aminoglycoside phosphotransferase family protein [Pyrinomonadaceae bacterium]|jgi:streptomycin 6-kinase
MSDRQLVERVEERVRHWNIAVEDTLETQSSFVVFGTRANLPVVLKISRRPGDEWLSGEVLDAFDGNGMVRVYEYIEGAVLLERLNPGTQLAGIAVAGRDEEATEILAEVIQRMSHPGESLEAFVTVEDWGKGFERYVASNDSQVPNNLVEQGHHIYTKLCATQKDLRLLHGDLQHYNVLFDSNRGWLAIDPKGVVGEIEYEIGAALRNPYERPELFASTEVVKRRLRRYEAKLKLDADRALAWGFAQAVLSAIWSVEDGFAVDAGNPAIMLANSIRPMLEQA